MYDIIKYLYEVVITTPFLCYVKNTPFVNKYISIDI